MQATPARNRAPLLLRMMTSAVAEKGRGFQSRQVLGVAPRWAVSTRQGSLSTTSPRVATAETPLLELQTATVRPERLVAQAWLETSPTCSLSVLLLLYMHSEQPCTSILCAPPCSLRRSRTHRRRRCFNSCRRRLPSLRADSANNFAPVYHRYRRRRRRRCRRTAASDCCRRQLNDSRRQCDGGQG